ncbi:uncharacterized protein LOC110189213 [Drosophila serrata]|uniref:uncharacterized protein LOC110189213 n=1 Tax=Drosophila serrata TaxID=7274 RepID=UPI000A1D0B0F|nr:uncharacterized protein LOC110189213 [Drosophila serrata]
MNQLSFVGCLLLCSMVVQGAFQDFVIGPESYLGDVEPPINEDQFLDDDAEQDVMVSFQDVQRNGVVDTSLLMKALMQHANRLGMSLDELAGLNMGGDDEAFTNQLGCSSDEDEFNYQDRPTWRDVLFN